MNALMAHVRYHRDSGEWIVVFTRGGLGAADSFTTSELIALKVLFDYLASVSGRAPVDAEWIGRGQMIELHEGRAGSNGWWIGSENVA